MLRRLRIKFILVNMAIVVAMLAVIFGLVITSTRNSLERDSMAVLQSALNGRGRRTPLSLPGGGPPELPDVSLPYFRVELDAAGNLIGYDGMFTNAAWQTEDLPRELSTLVEQVLARDTDTGILPEQGLRYLRGMGPAGVRVAFVDMTNEASIMDNLLRSSLFIGCASLAAFFAISLLLARWAVRPVETAWQRQKQFVSDASHELKTPLTVIMTNAELLASPEYDAVSKERFSANILTMARQMRGLVENLLELARVDNGAVEAAAAELDFSRLCENALLPFEPVCFEKGLTLTGEISSGIRVRGSEAYLRQVLEIFLDNAQKYAVSPGEIKVKLMRTGRQCQLSVANPGPEIPPDDLAHLFERFYRADKARTRAGSFGLGLSIAQKIVEVHHGKIWAESAGGKNTFFASFPIQT